MDRRLEIPVGLTHQRGAPQRLTALPRLAVAGDARRVEHLAFLGIAFDRTRSLDDGEAGDIGRDILHLGFENAIAVHQRARHRAHPQTLSVVGVRAARAVLELVQLNLDIPLRQAGDRRGQREIGSLTDRTVARDAGVEDRFAVGQIFAFGERGRSEAHDKRQCRDEAEEFAVVHVDRGDGHVASRLPVFSKLSDTDEAGFNSICAVPWARRRSIPSLCQPGSGPWQREYQKPIKKQ